MGLGQFVVHPTGAAWAEVERVADGWMVVVALVAVAVSLVLLAVLEECIDGW
jgi:hypothetical protein